MRSGRTLKPMIVAFVADASVMSFSLMPPTPRCTNASFTSSRSSLRRLSVRASSEPCTSAFTMRLSVADLALLDLVEDVLELHAAVRDCGHASLVLQPLPLLARLGDGLGRLEIGGDPELVARARHRRQAEHLHRCRGQRFLDLLTEVVDEGAHAAPCRTGDDRVADCQACPCRRAPWQPGRGRRRGSLRGRRPSRGPRGSR